MQPGGLVTAGDVPGEAAVMASFMNQVDLFRVVVPLPRTHRPLSRPCRRTTSSTGWCFAKLRKLNIAPSELADDAEYLRRVYLDVIGTLPTAERGAALPRRPAARQARPAGGRIAGAAGVCRLLVSAMERSVARGPAGAGGEAGLRLLQVDSASVASNQPFDQFARAVVTAEGPLGEDAPADFYKVVTKPGDEAGTLSQVFLGVRIACAECHHHPFDRWSTADYYGMTAYFTGSP